MLRSIIARIVDFSTRRRWTVIVVTLLVALAASIYSVRHFAIDTNIDHLISPELAWRKQEAEFERAFPQRAELILVVVQAPTPEDVKQATMALAARLAERRDVLKSVRLPGGGEFFEKNGLLYLGKEELARTTSQLTRAQPLLGTLASDPSLRGVLDALQFGAMGVQGGHFKLDDMARTLDLASDTLDRVVAGQKTSFSWRVMVKGKPADTGELRRFIEAHPILDFHALEPGHAATSAIRQTAAELQLAERFGASVRLTGPIPLSDEEFATLKESAPRDVAITLVAVIVILWLALHSSRLILACFISLIVGLAATFALGLILVGALNLISVAFAVLFIGLGVDFGIQFSVRYRAERHEVDDLTAALHNTGRNVGAQLTLAATAVAAGFFAFMPTDYRGLSELGIIAGTGMLIAFVTSVTLLPALISLFNPPGEPHELGYRALAPVDRFMERHRIAIVVITLAVAILGSPLLYYMHFDFNVLNMRSPKTESVATYLELKRDANTGINSIHVLAPSLAEAQRRAARIAQIPEVSQTMTLNNFVPEAQDEKLGLLRRAAATLNPTLNPQRMRPAPSDAENVRALTSTADALRKIANEDGGPGATAARRLADLLARVAKGDPALRNRARGRLRPAAEGDDGRAAQRPQGAEGDARHPAGRSQAGLDDRGRTGADRGDAEGRPERQRGDAQVRRRGATDRADGDRLPGLASGIRTHGGARLRRGRHLRARFDHPPAVGRAAALFRRAAHPGAAAARRRGDAGDLRPHQSAAQFRQHHRAAAAARRRRRLQDLLRDGVAGGPDQPAAVEPDARGVLQRDDHRHGVRQPVDVEPPGHVQHGQAAGALAHLHACGGGAVSARPHGPAAREGVEARVDGGPVYTLAPRDNRSEAASAPAEALPDLRARRRQAQVVAHRQEAQRQPGDRRISPASSSGRRTGSRARSLRCARSCR